MNRRALLIPLLGLAWGLNWPAVRLCLDEIPPWTLRTVGLGLGGLLLMGLILARGGSAAVPRRHWGRLMLVSLLSIAGYNILSALAQLSASTTRSAVLSYTMPIWAVIFARIFLGERFDTRRILGLTLGIGGLLALAAPLLQAGQLSWGLLFAVLSGVIWAAGNIVLKRFPIDAEPIVMTAWQLLFAACVTCCGMLLFEGVPALHPLRTETWLALLYHVLIGQALATALWFTILNRLPAGIASIGTLMVPAVGVLGALVVIGERPTPADWLGLVLIVAASATVLVRLPRAGVASQRIRHAD